MNFKASNQNVFVRVKFCIHDEKSYFLKWKRKILPLELKRLSNLNYPLSLTSKEREGLKETWKFISSASMYDLLNEDPGFEHIIIFI